MKRALGTKEAVALIVGSIVGSGIFLLPATTAALLGSPGLVFLVWTVCGLLAVTGGLTVAELGGMFPKAGGQYVFLREAFGPRVAFTYGWAFFWVIQTGIIAAVATAFAVFAGFFLPLDVLATRLVAVGVIVLLTAVNYVGVRYGAAVANVSTSAKVLAIVLLVLLGLALAAGRGSFGPFLPAEPPAGGLVSAFGLALVATLFAYDGFNQAAAVAGEVRDPGRAVPRATIVAVLLVMAVYLAAVAVYLHVLPIGEVAASGRLAADAAVDFLGPAGAGLVAAAVLVSTFGTVNAYVLSGPRVYYALAEDGRFYRGFKSLHARFATPDFGLVVQAEWACLLVLTGSFATLVNYVVVALACFHVLMGIALFRLRRERPDAPRPYRCWGYPVVPALFTLTMAFIVVNAVVTTPLQAGTAVLIVLSGVPVVFAAEWFARRRAAASA